MSIKQICTIIIFICIVSLGIIIFGNSYFDKSNGEQDNILNLVVKNVDDKLLVAYESATIESESRMAIVYDGMTLEELSDKLNRFLTSDLSGKGYLYASHSLELGIDPYLAVAISMHETGCTWGCSKLVKECNNVGGQVGKPNCNGGIYMAYDTLDDGIIGFLNNIYNNYYKYGLTTAAEMNSKYAADPNWSRAVNNYIEKIKKI